MAINAVTDLRNTDPGQTAFTVRQNPVNGSTACHAVQITQAATSGDGAGINVVSNNTSAPAIRTRAAGPLIQLFDATNNLKFQVANNGDLTMTGTFNFSGAFSATTLTSTGVTSVGTNLSVGGTTALTGALTGTSASFSTTLAATGNTTLGGTLGVTGTTTLTGAVTLTGGIAGNATLNGGDLTIQGTNKAYRFRRGGGGLDLEATGADLVVSNWSGANFDGTQRSYLRLSADAQNIQIAGKVEFADGLYGATKHILDGATNTIGFFGTAAAAKQAVAGSRGGNAALASLLTALATYGIITDGSTA